MSTLTNARIAGAPGYQVLSSGEIIGRRGYILRHEIVKGGYHRVCIQFDDGRRKHKLVHILMAEAFIGPIPAGLQVNHIDGDKGNNTPGNLEFVTPSENVRHSLDVLGVKRAQGEANSQSKLTESQVVQMREMSHAGHSNSSIAVIFNTDVTHVGRIITRRAWGHVA